MYPDLLFQSAIRSCLDSDVSEKESEGLNKKMCLERWASSPVFLLKNHSVGILLLLDRLFQTRLDSHCRQTGTIPTSAERFH